MQPQRLSSAGDWHKENGGDSARETSIFKGNHSEKNNDQNASLVLKRKWIGDTFLVLQNL